MRPFPIPIPASCFSVYAIVTAAKEAPAQPEEHNNNGGRLSFFGKIAEFFRNIMNWFKKLFGR